MRARFLLVVLAAAVLAGCGSGGPSLQQINREVKRDQAAATRERAEARAADARYIESGYKLRAACLAVERDTALPGMAPAIVATQRRQVAYCHREGVVLPRSESSKQARSLVAYQHLRRACLNLRRAYANPDTLVGQVTSGISKFGSTCRVVGVALAP